MAWKVVHLISNCSCELLFNIFEKLTLSKIYEFKSENFNIRPGYCL